MAYSDEALLDHLRELAAELGETPTQAQLNAAEERPSGRTYRDRFDSWANALRQAGVDSSETPGYTKSELITHLQELAAELDRTPTLEDLTAAEDRPSFKPYRNRFGTWNDSLSAAGLEPIHTMSHIQPDGYSDEELLTHLKEVAAELDRVPTQDDIEHADGRPSESTFKRRFGSWATALEEAGFGPQRRTRSYTDEELLELLNELAAELGDTPTLRQLNAADDYPSRAIYRNRFGSWGNALDAAGLD